MKFKRLIPALAMLLVSAILLGTSTFAWFSMNTTVTATGMNVQAVAEEGIVIANEDKAVYNVSATAKNSSVTMLYPGSTRDLSTWLHSKSTDPAAANTQQEYTAGTVWTNNTDGIGNYVQHTFYIRSSSAEAITVKSLDINSVTAKVGTNDAAQDLSKSLRVGIQFAGSSNKYIYAPVTGYTATVSVQNAAGAYTSETSGRTDVSALSSATVSKDTAVTSIPANTLDGVQVTVSIWYEGEDAACISDNIIANLEELAVTIEFGFTKNA